MKMNYAVLAILSASILPVSYQAFAAPQSFNGIISDAMCVKKHMMPGKPDAECIKECVKDGSSYVLVVDDKSYTLKAKAGTLAALAGKHVQVKGELNQNTLQVTEIHEAKGSTHTGMTM